MSAEGDLVEIDWQSLLWLARMAGMRAAEDADPAGVRAWLAAERQCGRDVSRPRPRRRRRHLRIVRATGGTQ